MSELRVEDLRAGVDGHAILHGIDLTVRSGEVHAVMGPNGSGKSTLSHVLMGRPGYQVLGGSITLDGQDLLALAPWERAQAGLFLALQYPTEVEGVSIDEVLETALAEVGVGAEEARARIDAEAGRLGVSPEWRARGVNVDMSGGEKKRSETLQLAVLEPRIAIIDELDSGLDIDALRTVSRRIEEATETGLGVLAITHYSRLLTELKPDHVHVLVRGTIQESGGPELATELEASGYDRWMVEEPSETAVGLGGLRRKPGLEDDPLADPFADPLA